MGLTVLKEKEAKEEEEERLEMLTRTEQVPVSILIKTRLKEEKFVTGKRRRKKSKRR